jgi:hypothetical protein
MTELYTNSRLRVLRQCLRLHKFRYELGIQTPSTPEAVFGTVGHSALEAYYRAWDKAGEYEPPDGTDEEDSEVHYGNWHEDMNARLPAALAVADSSPLSPFDRIKLRLLLIAYHERWGSEDWEILAVEQEFRYVLGEHLIGGKIDAIIRNRKDGRVYVLEHKFTGSETSLGGSYWEKLTLDSQVSIYIDGATMLGYDVAGCIYDVIKRPQHDQLTATPAESQKFTLGKGCRHCGGSAGGKKGIVKGRGHTVVVFASEVKHVPCNECKETGWKCDEDGAPQAPRLHANQRLENETAEQFEDRLLDVLAEAPDSWLQRSIVVRLEDELPRLRANLVEEIAVAEFCRSTDAWPMNPDSCFKFNSRCCFHGVCSGVESIDDNLRFPRGRAHPELDAI